MGNRGGSSRNQTPTVWDHQLWHRIVELLPVESEQWVGSEIRRLGEIAYPESLGLRHLGQIGEEAADLSLLEISPEEVVEAYSDTHRLVERVLMRLVDGPPQPELGVMALVAEWEPAAIFFMRIGTDLSVQHVWMNWVEGDVVKFPRAEHLMLVDWSRAFYCRLDDGAVLNTYLETLVESRGVIFTGNWDDGLSVLPDHEEMVAEYKRHFEDDDGRG